MLLLNEKYYGSNPYVKSIENNFQTIIDNLHSKGKLYNPTQSDEANNIRNALNKLFNFEDTDLKFISEEVGNGYTYPVTLIVTQSFSDYDMRETANGLAYVNSKGKICKVCLYTGLITVCELTAREITAVLLHEIGHNFFAGNVAIISSRLICLLNIFTFRNLKDLKSMLVGYTTTGRKINLQFNSAIYNVPVLNKAATIIQYVKSLVKNILIGLALLKSIMSIFNLPFKLLIRTPQAIVSFLIDIVRGGYYNEKFADNFATSYGYGEDLASMSTKFSRFGGLGSQKFLYEIPIVGSIIKFQLEVTRMILRIGDPHPKNTTRIKDQKRMLEHELAKGNDLYSKSQIQDMKEQVEAIDKIYQDYLDTSNTKGYAVIDKRINNMLNSLFNTDEDIRELFMKTNFDNDGFAFGIDNKIQSENGLFL